MRRMVRRLTYVTSRRNGFTQTGNFLKAGNVDVTALCDVYDAQFERPNRPRPNARPLHDHQQALDLKEIDATLIAVRESLACAHCNRCAQCRERRLPGEALALKSAEGPGIVKAARINNRVCQVSLQQHSGKHYLEANRDSGKFVTVTLSRTWWHGDSTICAKRPTCSEPSRRTSIGHTAWAASNGAIGIGNNTGTGAPISISEAARLPICSRIGSIWSTCSRGWMTRSRLRSSATYSTIGTAERRSTPSTCGWESGTAADRPRALRIPLH
jgi:hypothetical protein